MIGIKGQDAVGQRRAPRRHPTGRSRLSPRSTRSGPQPTASDTTAEGRTPLPRWPQSQVSRRPTAGPGHRRTRRRPATGSGSQSRGTYRKRQRGCKFPQLSFQIAGTRENTSMRCSASRATACQRSAGCWERAVCRRKGRAGAARDGSRKPHRALPHWPRGRHRCRHNGAKRTAGSPARHSAADTHDSVVLRRGSRQTPEQYGKASALAAQGRHCAECQGPKSPRTGAGTPAADKLAQLAGQTRRADLDTTKASKLPFGDFGGNAGDITTAKTLGGRSAHDVDEKATLVTRRIDRRPGRRSHRSRSGLLLGSLAIGKEHHSSHCFASARKISV